MPRDIKSDILSLMERDKQIEYTIPDFQKSLNIRNREHLVRALTELDKEGKIVSREKGTAKLYHLVQ